MHSSRRTFLKQAAAATLGFAGLRTLLAAGEPKLPVSPASDDPLWSTVGFGRLKADPRQRLDLPEGFSYQVISPVGETMDDGFRVPGKHDGMAAFAAPDGLTLLVRNHENEVKWTHLGPYGRKNELFSRVPRDKCYDAGRGRYPCQGATTTLTYDTRGQKLVGHYLSLSGTQYNCAGGPTPWGSWITCEENTARAGEIHEQDHGYPFEVPARREIGLVTPVPLKAMGRFRREAIAVDPASGVVYQTEDMADGVFTRFIPAQPGQLARGGRLQALVVRDRRSLDTRNWPADQGDGSGPLMPVGSPLTVEWMDLDDVESPKDDLRFRAFANGAARFARAEGIWRGGDGVYFACTNGGPILSGQIFRYKPSPFEGTPRESQQPARLELFLEPNDPRLLQNADNLTVSPWGDLVVCEDGPNQQFLVGITPQGRIYKIARNAGSTAEFAGACFSPDGTTLFVNIQGEGLTLAIHGPWNARRDEAV